MAPIAIADVERIMELTAGADRSVVWRAVDELVQRVIGHKLFTVMRQIHATSKVERLYSSNEKAYPVGGRKQKQGTPWGAMVLDRGEVFIAADAAAVREAFADHELITSLGISSIMNVPIRFGGRVLGTMNVSHKAGHFHDALVPPAKVIAGLLVPLLLAAGQS
ncbi:MAG: GAF domain-containing protein [Bradyrhizobiaceae bacterium]|nr:GAF domain-containing protein [Bradyrhizobiaceae bacterium]